MKLLKSLIASSMSLVVFPPIHCSAPSDFIATTPLKTNHKIVDERIECIV